MEIEDKKILAEWIGITIYNMEILPENPDYPLVWFFKETKWNKSPFYFKIEYEDGEEWGPDYNHKQFKDIWNKLTFDQAVLVTEKIKSRHPEYMAKILLNDLPKVCQAVVEVIKDQKSGT